MNLVQKLVLQIVKRWAAKTPWFFKVVQYLSGLIALILLLPQWVAAYQGGGFELPQTWGTLIQEIVGYALIAQSVIVQLTATPEEKEKKGIK